MFPTTTATSDNTQDQTSLRYPAQPAHKLPCSGDSLLYSTQVSIDDPQIHTPVSIDDPQDHTPVSIDDPQDHTPVSSLPQSVHSQAGHDVRTAFSKFISFMNEPDRIQPIHKEDYPKHRKVCQKALEDATSATADRSEVETNLSQFDKVWSELPDYIIRKNQAPDLTEEEYIEYEDRWLRMDYHRAKFEAMALNPDGCTERLKDDDSLLHGHELDSELLDTAYLEFS